MILYRKNVEFYIKKYKYRERKNYKANAVT